MTTTMPTSAARLHLILMMITMPTSAARVQFELYIGGGVWQDEEKRVKSAAVHVSTTI